jgi:hypothetical protein
VLRGLLFGCQLLSSDLYEGRHARWVHSETLSNQVIVGSQFAQTQPDPIRPRQIIGVRRRHRSSVPESWPGGSQYLVLKICHRGDQISQTTVHGPMADGRASRRAAFHF